MRISLLVLSCLMTLFCFSQAKTGHITIKRNGSECIIDADNRELIPSGRYSHIWTSYDTAAKFFVVTDFKDKKGIYALGEKEVVPCIYDDIRLFHNHGFVSKGNKWAVLTSDFREASDFIFEDVFGFNEQGRSFVKIDSQWVLIDTNGKTVKKIPFETVLHFGSYDLYKKAGGNHQFGFIDRDANIVIPMEYENVGDAVYSGLVFPVKKGGRWGYVNKENKLILPFQYDYLTPIYKGFGWIRDKHYHTIGLVDANGKLIFDDGRYVDVEYANESKLVFTEKAPVSGQYLKGYLDSATFRVLIPAQFHSCDWFYNGQATVKKNGLSAVIDSMGNLVLPYQYETISRWGDHYIVSLKRKWGMIDRRGHIITPLEYDGIAYGGFFATISKGNLQGIMHYDGKVLVPPKYDHVRNISNEVFYASKDGKNYLVNSKGEEREIE